MRVKVPTVFRRIQSPSLIVNKKFAVNRPILAPTLLVPKLINVKPIHVNVFKIPNRVQVPFFPKTNWNFNQRNWFSTEYDDEFKKKNIVQQNTKTTNEPCLFELIIEVVGALVSGWIIIFCFITFFPLSLLFFLFK